MVSCCVLWNSKITETVHEGVTKFVWQLGRYEPSYPVGCCALLCDYSGPWPPARQGVREDNRARFPLVEVAPQGRARVSLEGNRFHSLRHYTVKKVGSKWVRATRLTNFAHYVLLKLYFLLLITFSLQRYRNRRLKKLPTRRQVLLKIEIKCFQCLTKITGIFSW